MKKIIQIFLLVCIAVIILVKTGKPVFLFFSQIIYSSPCDEPIHYKIEYVDSRFHLSRAEFQSAVEQATQIWDQPLGKNLFQFDPQATSLSVNLIFDERQSLTNQIGNLESQLKNEKNSIDPQVLAYQTLSADFKTRLSSLNDQISFWNSKGGAPQDEYSKLKTEQANLQQEATKLNAMAKNLNGSTTEYNAQVGQLNQTVDTYNSALQLRPEEGVYDPKNNRINIYFDISHDELVHTLAHELGHSLGLDHIPNKLAIMFPKTTQTIQASPDDIAALGKICQKKTIFDRISEGYSLLMNRFSNPKN